MNTLGVHVEQGDASMLLLVQTQPGLSGTTGRMFAELCANVLGLVEPAFPLAFGEYGPVLSLANIIALIVFAGFFGLVHSQIDGTADLHERPRPAPAPAEPDTEAGANTSISAPAIALTALAAVFSALRVAVLSYLAISAVLFAARLLAGGS